MDIGIIAKAVTNFRTAIETCHHELGVYFSRFPAGSCNDASAMLAEYLGQADLGVFERVRAERKSDRWSHVWLERDKVIVDITVDQFKEARTFPFVTCDRAWHDITFKICERIESGSFRYDSSLSKLSYSYELIIKNITLNETDS